MNILIGQGDPALAAFLSKGLAREQNSVDVAADAENVLICVRQFDYALAVLDLDLPGPGGIELLRLARSSKETLLILALWARNEIEDRVQALDAGADDFVGKPFSYFEFSARVRALLRRHGRPASARLCAGDVELDRVQRIVQRSGTRIKLTPKEFALLELLMLHSGRQVSRTMIMEHVWNLPSGSMTNVVDVYIKYLRIKLGDSSRAPLIRTIRGVGYQIALPAVPAHGISGNEPLLIQRSAISVVSTVQQGISRQALDNEMDGKRNLP